MPEKISIVKDTGETISSNIMSVFMIPETNKQYIITTENAVDPHGLTVLHVSEIDNGKLVKVRTDDEWATIKTIMRAIISASVGSYVYIPTIANATVEGQYSRDISVSAGAAKQLSDSYINGKKEVPPSSDTAGGVNANAIESDSIFPTAPNENDQDNEIVPGIEEVDNSVNIEPTTQQPDLSVGAEQPVNTNIVVENSENNLDSVSEAVATQVATENTNPIDIPIIDENNAPASDQAVIPQPYVDSPIVNEVVATNAQTNEEVATQPVVNTEGTPDLVPQVPDAGTEEPIPGVIQPEGEITVPDVAIIDPTMPAPPVPVVDTPNLENPVPEVPTAEMAPVPEANLALAPAEATSAPVTEAPIGQIEPLAQDIVPENVEAPAPTEMMPTPEATPVPEVAPVPEVTAPEVTENPVVEQQVVAPTVTIDTESIANSITNSINTSLNEKLDSTIPTEISKVVGPSIESSVAPAVVSALSSIMDEKVKAPIEQKIEDVMNKVVEEKVQAPLMDTVTKTVNDTIEKQSKALNSLGIKLDFGVESSFGKNASLDEIVAGSQELFVEGVKNLIMVMTERVYKELRIKEDELKRREIIVAQREQAVNDKTMAMLNGTYDPNSYVSSTPSVIPTTANIPTSVPAAPQAPVQPVTAPVPEVTTSAPAAPAAPVVDVQIPGVPESAVPVEETSAPVTEPAVNVPVVDIAPLPGDSAPQPAPEAVPSDAPAVNIDIVSTEAPTNPA